MRRVLSVSVPVAIVVVLLAPLGLGAQENGRVARATFVDEPPAIDGLVNDAVWELADPITDFIQTEPVEGTPASERTIVRIVYNDRAVFVGVICYDAEPDQILVTDSRRDSDLGDTDSFQIIFDTYHDRQNGFVFGTNPAGIEYDGQVSNEGQGGGRGGGRRRAQTGSGSGFNKNWDSSWTVRTHVNEIGWMAEFEIPLRTLRYGDRPQVWGMNFQRNIRRKREQVFWAPIERIYNLYRLSSAGELHGLELEAPRNFKITPYAVATASRNFLNPEETETDFDPDAGLDAKFGVTPSLNLDLTYNTDFAQVEVDEEVVNLTRFNVRLPEKRPFFLENAGLFAAGKSGVDLFFSRRIGIDPSGVEVPIIGGARLSGKVGAFNVGVLNMETDDVAGVTPKNNFTVARLSRELPNRTAFGGIVVNREANGSNAGPDDWNRTWGVDGRLGIGSYTDFRGFMARTETPGRTAGEGAYSLRGEYQRVGGDFHVEYTQVDEDFNPEVGFLTRRAYRYTDIGFMLRRRFADIPWLRELRPHSSARTHWDLDGFKETEEIHIDTHVDFESGWFFSPAVNLTTEGLKVPFEISEGIIIPPGTYKHAEIDWRFNTDSSRALSFSSTLTVGGFYSGNQRSFSTTVNGRRGSNLSASVGWNRSDINLPEGEFVTDLVQTRFNYSFTPLINLQSLVQYNTRSSNWSGNFRFGWLNTAGTGLFIVYNETQGLEGFTAPRADRHFGPIRRSFIVKFSRQFDVLR